MQRIPFGQIVISILLRQLEISLWPELLSVSGTLNETPSTTPAPRLADK